MKFLLIAARNERGEQFTFPLGMAYISSVLKKEGHVVHCLNMEFEQNPTDSLRACLKEHSPDVVGIGALSHSFTQVKNYFEDISKFAPHAVKILGGGMATGDPEFITQSLPINIAVIGEGEQTITEVAKALENDTPLSSVKGIYIKRDDNSVVKTEERPPIANLDDLPWPDYEGFHFERHLEKHGPRIEMIASRGCPYSCTFCSSNLGRKYRTRSLENFHAELMHYVDLYGITSVAIYDELFTANRERMMSFCEMMRQNDVYWWTQLRIDSFDEDMLIAMKNSGCTFLSLGLESMNNSVLSSMNKKITTQQLQQGLAQTKDCKIGFFGNFIFGDAAETFETAWETLKWWRENLHYGINMGFIHCYPGSQIYDYAITNNKISSKNDFYNANIPLVNFSQMTQDEFNCLQDSVNFYREALLFPGGIEKIQFHDEQHTDIFDVTVSCPHCSTKINYNNISRSSITFERINIFRPTCKECFCRFDVPLLFPLECISKELENRLLHAEDLLKSGEAITALDEGKSLLPEASSYSPLYFFISKCYFTLNDSHNGFTNLQHAMRLNPLQSEYFHTYSAMRAQFNDPYDETEFFSRQGAILETISAVYKIEQMKNP